MAALRTRLATPEDRAAIREVCLSAVGPDDYVLHDIDSWSRTGEISLAEDGAGGVLGIIRTIDLPDGSAWLGSIRTVKGAQRRGVATELTGAAMARAKRRGMTRARMLISSKNTPSLGVAAKSGFDEVFRAAVLEKGEEGADPEDVIRKTRPGPPAARGAGLYFHPTGSPEALVALAKPLGRGELTESPIIRGLRGFAGLFFMFVSAENEVLERCAPRTVPVFVDGERFIFTANRTEPWHALQPLTHGPGVAKAAVRALEIGGVGEGLVYLPMDERFHRAYIEAGFEYSKWAREAVVLERLL